MTDLRPHAVELRCGCRPLFHPPFPQVGAWISCLFHQRGELVVAVECVGKPKRVDLRRRNRRTQGAAAVMEALDEETQ